MGQDARTSTISLTTLKHRLSVALSSTGKRVGQAVNELLSPSNKRHRDGSFLFDTNTATPAPAADYPVCRSNPRFQANLHQSPKHVRTMRPSTHSDDLWHLLSQPGRGRVGETDYGSPNWTAGRSRPRRSCASPNLAQAGARGGSQPGTMLLSQYQPAAPSLFTPHNSSVLRHQSPQRWPQRGAASHSTPEPEDMARSTPSQAVATALYDWSRTPRIQSADTATPSQPPFGTLREIAGIDRPTHDMHMEPLKQLDNYRRRIAPHPSPASTRSHPRVCGLTTPMLDATASPLRTYAVMPQGADINDIKDKVSRIDLTTDQEELEEDALGTLRRWSAGKRQGSENFNVGPNSSADMEQARCTELHRAQTEKRKLMAARKLREAQAEAERAIHISTDFEEVKRVRGDRDIEASEAKLKHLEHIAQQSFAQLQIKYNESMDVDRKQDITLRPLSDEDARIVDSALGKGNPEEVLASSDFTNIDIRRGDMNCLDGLNWLNDEVINFYMGMLQERQLRLSPGNPRVHFFNTFFYNALSKDEGKYNYQKVRRWTTEKRLKGYCILDCQKVVVPIHQGCHWVLGVINLSEQAIEYYDSMGGSDDRALEDLARYIADEYRDKRSQDVNASEWRHFTHKKIPHQQNCCDCGVFMVTFAEFLSRDAKFTFSQANMPLIRRRMVAQIMHGAVDN